MEHFSNCFDLQSVTVRAPGNVARHPLCYGFIFINKGNIGCRINQTFLKPHPAGQPDLSGESFSYVDAEGRLYKNNFQVVFDPFTLPADNPLIEIHQVHYVQV